MNVEIIYEKNFPKLEIPSKYKLNNTKSTNEDAKRFTFDEIMEHIYKNVIYVLMPERTEKTQKFIRKAIEVSEFYEIDIKIEKYPSHISAIYYFNCGGGMKSLIDIIKEADEITFFKNIQGYDIVMCLDYYTHASFRNGRQIEP